MALRIIPVHFLYLYSRRLVFDTERGGWWCRGRGLVGKSLRCLVILPANGNSVSLAGRIHYALWRRNTGAFLSAKALMDQTQNTLFPVFRQLTIHHGPLALARGPLIACQSLWSCPEWRAAVISQDRGETIYTLGWLMWLIR